MTKNKTEGYLVIITNYNFNRKYYLHRTTFNEKFNFNNYWDSELIVETNSRNKIKMYIDISGFSCKKIRRISNWEWRLFYV